MRRGGTANEEEGKTEHGVGGHSGDDSSSAIDDSGRAGGPGGHKDLLFYMIQQRDEDKVTEDVFIDNLLTLLFG